MVMHPHSIILLTGTSYEEFLRRTEHIGPHVVVVRDTLDNVFGAFVTDGWRRSKSNFFGAGECFLFCQKRGEDFKAFYATLKNECYQMADETGFSVGAGDRYVMIDT